MRTMGKPRDAVASPITPNGSGVAAGSKTAAEPGLLSEATHFLFFTGKGGVGKTSLSAATALALSDTGKSVLLVSTDAASNLDEMLGVPLRNSPTAVPGAPGLSVMVINPDAAAEAYRERVLLQMEPGASDSERSAVREQLSGACTTEIAAFDEFSTLLGQATEQYDHVIFDTAPTGHTLRLLSLPKAWTGFLAGNDRGASCLGPHSGLKMRERGFQTALRALGDSAQTMVVLVTRADKGAIAEAGRTSAELSALGLGNQRLAVNGVFHASDPLDPVARSIEAAGQQALAELPEPLAGLPRDEIRLRAFDMVGLPALRALFRPESEARHESKPGPSPLRDTPTLDLLTDELAAAGRGLIMVMGKGGVGKTTIAAALAIGLVQRGHSVHLSTTDPAAHLAVTVAGALPGLQVDRIDPKEETRRYIEKTMAARSPGLDAQGQALLREDLQSPCTEEIAVFHAFSRIVAEGRSAFVVLDTAPTGHTVLLMDAAGAYHRQIMREFQPGAAGRVVTPLMRLQDPAYTRILIVTLPETTPVSQAAALQEDLRRARIEPYGWVINKSIGAAGTDDALLTARLESEARQVERVRADFAPHLFVVPWLIEPPIGIPELAKLTARPPKAA
jgi:arsenite-transporting ATPase